tara:strand:+ start:1702 stop:2556 length:855 start_codon:yes stop_codon:yes gene_type:complete
MNGKWVSEFLDGLDEVDLQACNRANVMRDLSPALSPPSDHIVWKLAGKVFPDSIADKYPRPKTNKTADVLKCLHEVVVGWYEVTRAANWMQEDPANEEMPTSFSKDAFAYLVGMHSRVTLQLSDPPVLVAPSPIHDRGVFATRNLKANELVTTYPIDAIRVLMNKLPTDNLSKDKLPFAFMYRDPSYDDDLALEWDDYKVSVTTPFSNVLPSDTALAIYGNPNVHTVHACGHMINDPKGTGKRANCTEVPLAGGAAMAIMITAPIRAGEELLLKYGKGYWFSRE